jgi:type II secretory pathway pseudopilin PulG
MLNVRNRRRGFSLVEAAIATAIVGIGIVALMTLAGSTSRMSDGSRQLSTGVFLAQELREWTVKLGFEQVASLNNLTCDPPISGQGSPIADMVGWSQKLNVTYRNTDNLALASTGATGVLKVAVLVSYRSRPVASTSWLVARKE